MPDYLSIARRAVLRDQPVLAPDRLEDVLQGVSVEFSAGHIYIVADEADAQRLGVRRGHLYTAAEVRRVVQLGDAESVLEVHAWKLWFDGRVRSVERAESAKRPVPAWITSTCAWTSISVPMPHTPSFGAALATTGRSIVAKQVDPAILGILLFSF